MRNATVEATVVRRTAHWSSNRQQESRYKAYEVRFGAPVNETRSQLPTSYIVRHLTKCTDRDSDDFGRGGIYFP